MRRLLVLAALGGPALPLVAQSPPVVALGSKVRLHIPAGNGKFLPRFDGTVTRISGDTLTLRPKTGGGSRLHTPSSQGQLTMLTSQRDATVKGAVIGGLTGVLAGGLVATLGGQVCNGSSVLCYSRRHVALRNASVLGAAGIVIGAAIGALSPQKTWSRVWMTEASAGLPSEPGRFRLGLSLAF